MTRRDECTLGEEPNHTPQQWRLARFDQSRLPLITQLNQVTKERPLKKDVVSKRIRRSAILGPDHQIGLQPCNLRDGGIFELPGANVLAKIAYALFSKINKRALPLWHCLRRRIVSGPIPPCCDQIDLRLRRCHAV